MNLNCHEGEPTFPRKSTHLAEKNIPEGEETGRKCSGRLAVDQADPNPSQDETEDILARLVVQRQRYLPSS